MTIFDPKRYWPNHEKGDDLKRAEQREREAWQRDSFANPPRLTLDDTTVTTYPPIKPRQAKTCVHDGSVPILTLTNGTTLYGARGHSLVSVGHLDLILDLAGAVKLRPFLKSPIPRRFQRLKIAQGPDVVRFDWPDMSAPGHIGITFWSSLLSMLPGRVCIACIGSHGRTGTALAALLVADGIAADQAIGIVREKHCHHAIETAAQEHYIRDLGKQFAVVNTSTEGV